MSSRTRTLWLLPLALGLAHCSAERTNDAESNDLMVAPDVTSCPLITAVSALPGETLVGSSVLVRVTLSAESEVRWSGSGGTIAEPARRTTLFTCEVPGAHVLTVRLVGVDPNCGAASALDIRCTRSLADDAGMDASMLDAATDAAAIDTARDE